MTNVVPVPVAAFAVSTVASVALTTVVPVPVSIVAAVSVVLIVGTPCVPGTRASRDVPKMDEVGVEGVIYQLTAGSHQV